MPAVCGVVVDLQVKCAVSRCAAGLFGQPRAGSSTGGVSASCLSAWMRQNTSSSSARASRQLTALFTLAHWTCRRTEGGAGLLLAQRHACSGDSSSDP